jgi:plastocyanin
MKRRIILFIIVMLIIAGLTANSLYKKQKVYEQQTANITPTPYPVLKQEIGEKMIDDDDKQEGGKKAAEILQVDEEGVHIDIIYTNFGFSPSLLIVKAGTKVTWKNTSTQQMWVASDPHPTHTDLSGFDEQTAVASGEIYSYTFTKQGQWKYHNHVGPGDRGMVQVNP